MWRLQLLATQPPALSPAPSPPRRQGVATHAREVDALEQGAALLAGADSAPQQAVHDHVVALDGLADARVGRRPAEEDRLVQLTLQSQLARRRHCGTDGGSGSTRGHRALREGPGRNTEVLTR